MKTFTVATVAAIATFPAVFAADLCTPTQMGSLLSFAGPAGECSTATGYMIVPPTAYPTEEQAQSICDKCKELVKSTNGVTFPDCDLGTINIQKLFSGVASKCNTVTPTVTSVAPTPAKTTLTPSTTSPSATKSPGTSTPSTPSSTSAAPATTVPQKDNTQPDSKTAPTTTGSQSGGNYKNNDVIETPGNNKKLSPTSKPPQQSTSATVSLSVVTASLVLSVMVYLF